MYEGKGVKQVTNTRNTLICFEPFKTTQNGFEINSLNLSNKELFVVQIHNNITLFSYKI